jgi:O-antigen/teichoic acid export membrane protein
MKLLNYKAKVSTFSRNILIVSVGTVIAQVIPSAISPLLTRIYTPEDFGLYGIYMAIVSLLVTLAAGRYDLAIFIPANVDDSKRLVILSIGLSALFSLLTLIVIIPFHGWLLNFTSNKEMAIWLYTIPFIVFFISLFQAISQWLNRIKEYKQLGILRMTNSGILSGLNLGVGLIYLKVNGLILSTLITQILLSLMTVKYIKSLNAFLNIKRLKVLMKRYINFPKFLLPSTFAGEAAVQVPILLLTNFFGVTTSGFFLLANKVLVLPMSVIGNSIGEVYRQEAAEEFYKKGNCTDLYKKTLLKLAIIGIVPAVVLFFGGKYLFTIVFGVTWTTAGEMASYLSLMLFFQMISTPMAYTILLVNGQKIDLYLQLGRLTLSILSIVIGGMLNSYKVAIILFSLSYSLYYVANSLFQYTASKGRSW